MMTNEEREKHIRIANMLIGVINDLERPMLMYQVEKNVAKEALENYIKMLEQQPCEDWYDVPSDEMTLGQARQAVKDLRKKLVEYLEQQPCDNCVSRAYIESIVEELENICINGDDYILSLLSDIKNAPSVTPQPNKSENPTSWIPVTERLPKENEYIGNVCKYYLIQDEYGDMHVAHLTNVGWIPMESLRAISSEITAWRELPKPYKAESEEEK